MGVCHCLGGLVLDAILSDKAHARQSRLAWLREPSSRVGGRSLFEILDKIELIRATGVPGLQLPAAFHPRLGQVAREGVRYTAQAFQQMGPAPADTPPWWRRCASSRPR